MSPTDPRHGTVAGYVAHGKAGTPRCEPCKEANRRYEAQRRIRAYIVGPGLIPATGTIRRLQALMALGYPLRELDARLGRKKTFVHSLMRNSTTVNRQTAAQVDALFRELCMKRPEGYQAERTRGLAARNGYAPPLAWDDIDDPTETPRGWQATEVDRFARAENLADLDQQHAGITAACRHLQITRDALEKWCARHDLSAVYSRMVRREQPDYERYVGVAS